MFIAMGIKIISMLVAFSLFPNFSSQAQDLEGFTAERDAASAFALKHLSDRDPVVRQHAAEVLAKFSAVEHLRLAEGYRLQEKNERVRLALDWALYRMGRTNALYGVARELKSDGRRAQAVDYLSQLANPQLLYVFFDRADGKTLVGLLEVMANIGDADTLDFVKQFEASFLPHVAKAAKLALSRITERLAQLSPDVLTRPREVKEN